MLIWYFISTIYYAETINFTNTTYTKTQLFLWQGRNHNLVHSNLMRVESINERQMKGVKPTAGRQKLSLTRFQFYRRTEEEERKRRVGGGWVEKKRKLKEGAEGGLRAGGRRKEKKNSFLFFFLFTFSLI